MQLQSKKNTLAVLLVGWLVVLGSYLIIRFVFILIGFTLNPTILGICLAVIPCLLETAANRKEYRSMCWGYLFHPSLKK